MPNQNKKFSSLNLKQYSKKEIKSYQGSFDKFGFYNMKNGDFFDHNGYYFNEEGYDASGGYYDDNSNYVPR